MASLKIRRSEVGTGDGECLSCERRRMRGDERINLLIYPSSCFTRTEGTWWKALNTIADDERSSSLNDSTSAFQEVGRGCFAGPPAMEDLGSRTDQDGSERHGAPVSVIDNESQILRGPRGRAHAISRSWTCFKGELRRSTRCRYPPA